MATHSNGISALQLQRQLALGSYKSAWLMAAKLRRSLVAPDRSMLAGLVEVDETEIVCRSKNDPLTGGGGRSHQGKILVAGAVEVEDGGAGPGRIRLAKCRLLGRQPACFPQNQSRPWRHRQDRRMVGISRRAGVNHDPHVVGNMAAISSSPGRTASSPTLKSGPWASITACAAATCTSASCATVTPPTNPAHYTHESRGSCRRAPPLAICVRPDDVGRAFRLMSD